MMQTRQSRYAGWVFRVNTRLATFLMIWLKEIYMLFLTSFSSSQIYKPFQLQIHVPSSSINHMKTLVGMTNCGKPTATEAWEQQLHTVQAQQVCCVWIILAQTSLHRSEVCCFLMYNKCKDMLSMLQLREQWRQWFY